jgi:hypothetical protein
LATVAVRSQWRVSGSSTAALEMSGSPRVGIWDSIWLISVTARKRAVRGHRLEHADSVKVSILVVLDDALRVLLPFVEVDSGHLSILVVLDDALRAPTVQEDATRACPTRRRHTIHHQLVALEKVERPAEIRRDRIGGGGVHRGRDPDTSTEVATARCELASVHPKIKL